MPQVIVFLDAIALALANPWLRLIPAVDTIGFIVGALAEALRLANSLTTNSAIEEAFKFAVTVAQNGGSLSIEQRTVIKIKLNEIILNAGGGI
jgi:hypothetical protein